MIGTLAVHRVLGHDMLASPTEFVMPDYVDGDEVMKVTDRDVAVIFDSCRLDVTRHIAARLA